MNKQDIGLFLISITMIFLFVFAEIKNENRKVYTEIIEFIDKDLHFLNKEIVNKLLIQKNLIGSLIPKDAVDLKGIEQGIDKNPMVYKSEVYLTLDGSLKIVIRQKRPLVRVFDESFSYYIDSEGGKMPLSISYTIKVPIVTGELSGVTDQSYLDLFNMLHTDVFLKNDVVGVHIQDNGGVVLTGRTFDFKIYIGTPVNLGLKFKNYKAFVQKAVEDQTIDQYRLINLMYNNQVVCAKL